MSFQNFINASGFKVLAMARLSECQYSLVLYLFNCTVSGMGELITTENELASVVGYDEETVRESLEELSARRIVETKYKNANHPRERLSMKLKVNYNVSTWAQTYQEDADSTDAIVFPFRRGQAIKLVHSDNTKEHDPKCPTIIHTEETWERVFNAFKQGREVEEESYQLIKEDARMLIETHPVDQVLLVLRHFGDRIPTLSLLASSWQHYQHLFAEETQKVDLAEARHKHLEQDHRLHDAVEILLNQASDLNLEEEEKSVLNILFNHRYPRRQLFWAYQARSRYPNLKKFFDDNKHLMIPVTSSGSIVKKTT